MDIINWIITIADQYSFTISQIRQTIRANLPTLNQFHYPTTAQMYEIGISDIAPFQFNRIAIRQIVDISNNRSINRSISKTVHNFHFAATR